MKTNLTVLLPVLNEEKYLDRCLNSIFNQTFTKFNLICINDGSTDKTGIILSSWKKKFGPRMQVVTHKSNIGFTDTLNEGLAMINTTWTGRIDADDYWHPEKLAKQITYLSSHPETKLIGCSYINLTERGQQVVNLPETNDEIRNYFRKDNPFGHSCVIFDTKLAKSLGGYNKDFYPSDDYELWFRFSRYGKLYNLKETYCSRHLGDGISIRSQNLQLKNCIRIQSIVVKNQNLSVLNYVYIIPTILTLLSPNWLRKLKRSIFN